MYKTNVVYAPGDKVRATSGPYKGQILTIKQDLGNGFILIDEHDKYAVERWWVRHV